jgi:hypothetical protein
MLVEVSTNGDASIVHTITETMLGDNSESRLDTLMKEVAKLGRESGLGKDARMKLAMRVSQAAFDGTIGEDDVPAIYETYVKAESSKAIHEHTANGKTAQLSKFRQVVRASMMPSTDMPASLQAIVDKRDELRAAEVKLKPAFETAVLAARWQIAHTESQGVLPGEVIDELVRKPEAEDKELLERLQAEYKKLYDLESKANEGATVNSTPEAALSAIEEARHKIGEAIIGLDGELPPVTKEQKKVANLIVQARAAGIKVG